MKVTKAGYERQQIRTVTAVRAGLVSNVYDHAIRLSGDTLRDGSAMTLMGTDVERIVNSLRVFHELWAAILDISIAIYLLERQVEIACVIPIAIALGKSFVYIAMAWS